MRVDRGFVQVAILEVLLEDSLSIWSFYLGRSEGFASRIDGVEEDGHDEKLSMVSGSAQYGSS